MASERFDEIEVEEVFVTVRGNVVTLLDNKPSLINS
jgi:hypothetical protein